MLSVSCARLVWWQSHRTLEAVPRFLGANRPVDLGQHSASHASSRGAAQAVKALGSVQSSFTEGILAAFVWSQHNRVHEAELGLLSGAGLASALTVRQAVREQVVGHVVLVDVVHVGDGFPADSL